MIKTLDTVEGRRIRVEAYASPFEVAQRMFAAERCIGENCPLCGDDGMHAENVFAPELLT